MVFQAARSGHLQPRFLRALPYEPSFLDDDEAVADPLQFVKQMARYEKGDPVRLVQLQNQVAKLANPHRIQPVGLARPR